MKVCAPNVLHATRPGSCRHEARWAAAGTLSVHPLLSPVLAHTRIFSNRLRRTSDFFPFFDWSSEWSSEWSAKWSGEWSEKGGKSAKMMIEQASLLFGGRDS